MLINNFSNKIFLKNTYILNQDQIFLNFSEFLNLSLFYFIFSNNGNKINSNDKYCHLSFNKRFFFFLKKDQYSFLFFLNQYFEKNFIFNKIKNNNNNDDAAPTFSKFCFAFFILNGLGYKIFFLKKKYLVLDLGFSHFISFLIPKYFFFKKKKNRLLIFSSDFFLLGLISYFFSTIRKLDVYKFKGFVLKNNFHSKNFKKTLKKKLKKKTS